MLVIGSSIFRLGSSIFYFFTKEIKIDKMLFAISLLILVILISLIYIRYILGEDNLIVKIGFIRTTIPYSEIVSVKEKRNPISSPALSLDRIEIIWKKSKVSRGVTYISPKEKELFLENLNKKIEEKEKDRN